MPDEAGTGETAPIRVESLLRVSKSFPAGFSDVRFGKYTIKALPCASAEFSDVLLCFDDQVLSHEAHPEQESEMIARFLGLVLNAKIERLATRINTFNVP